MSDFYLYLYKQLLKNLRTMKAVKLSTLKKGDFFTLIESKNDFTYYNWVGVDITTHY